MSQRKKVVVVGTTISRRHTCCAAHTKEDKKRLLCRKLIYVQLEKFSEITNAKYFVNMKYDLVRFFRSELISRNFCCTIKTDCEKTMIALK